MHFLKIVWKTEFCLSLARLNAIHLDDCPEKLLFKRSEATSYQFINTPLKVNEQKLL